ncbi:hypothetical protein ACFCVU_19065 [Peribacillus butanolivorans]
MTGYAMVCLGAMAGFLTGITNPYNVGVAQGIVELPLFPGWDYLAVFRQR